MVEVKLLMFLFEEQFVEEYNFMDFGLDQDTHCLN